MNSKKPLAVEYRAISALEPYARNARTHTPAQIEQVARSITEFGWTNPILVDGGNGIIAGHCRVQAAAQLGMSEVPCIELDGMSDEQRRAYIIADNRLAENAGWDFDTLKLEFADLDAAGFDLSLTGFDGFALESLLEPAQGLTDEDDAPALPDEPTAVTGDLWRLGSHRLLCGDATSADDVARLLDGVKPLLMVTDPPYGVEYDPDWRNSAEQAGQFGKNGGSPGVGRAGSGRAVGRVSNDDRSDWREAWALFPGDVAYVWHAGRHASAVQASLESAGFEIRNQVIWAKDRFPISRGHYHWQHEPCWYAVRNKGHWQGSRKESTLWQIDHRKSETGHGTQKPVECMRRPMQNNSSQGQAVYDPFMGSGTSLIAAETVGRQCFGMEIDPKYVDVAVQRWEAFTGQKAELERDCGEEAA